jgi:hypothetical protein
MPVHVRSALPTTEGLYDPAPLARIFMAEAECLLTNGVPGAVPPGVEWPGRLDDHSPPSTAKVKNE